MREGAWRPRAYGRIDDAFFDKGRARAAGQRAARRDELSAAGPARSGSSHDDCQQRVGKKEGGPNSARSPPPMVNQSDPAKNERAKDDLADVRLSASHPPKGRSRNANNLRRLRGACAE